MYRLRHDTALSGKSSAAAKNKNIWQPDVVGDILTAKWIVFLCFP